MMEAEKQNAMGLERQWIETFRDASRARRSDLEQAEHLKTEATRKQQPRMTQADLFRASFSFEAMTSSVHFDNFEDHPESAVMIYHLNNGHGKFELLKSLIQQANENEGMVDEVTQDLLLEEIELEKLTPEEHEKLVETFLSFQGREYVSKNKDTSPNKIAMLDDTLDCHLLICGLCGVRTIHERYEEYCEVVGSGELSSSDSS
jgi:hypothetical protein